MAWGTMWASEPRCDGWAKAWAIVRSSGSKNAQEKSPRVLMLVEYAARRSVAPISSVIAVSALRSTSNRTGSMAMRARLLQVLSLDFLGGRNRATQNPPGAYHIARTAML